MKNRQPKLLDFWPLFFLLALLEAAVALFVLLRVPAEGAGFSATRWALILPLMGVLAGSAFWAYSSWHNSNFRNRWLDVNARPKLYGILSLAFPLLAVVAGIGAFLLRWWDPERLLPFFERAWPLLAFAIIQGLSKRFLARFPRPENVEIEEGATRTQMFIAIGVVIALVLFAAFVLVNILG